MRDGQVSHKKVDEETEIHLMKQTIINKNVNFLLDGTLPLLWLKGIKFMEEMTYISCFIFAHVEFYWPSGKKK